jgi:prolipoprotein diacylglyceryltransferase
MAMYELAYLIPVNALILWMAFRRRSGGRPACSRWSTGLLYAPVRFVLEFWRLNQSDSATSA